MHAPASRWMLMAVSVAAAIPAVVLLLTFSPAFVQRLPTQDTAIGLTLVRLACVLALAAVIVLVAFRTRLDALLRQLQAHVQAAAATATVTAPGEAPRWAVWTLLSTATVVAIVAIVVAVASPSDYRALIAEDGLVEYGSALAWGCAVLSSLIALSLDRRRFRIKLAWYGALIAFCVFAGGEEISWGQRILGYQTPETLAALNKQREANLHDIGSITVFANAFFVLTTLCCLVAPLLLERAREWRVYLRQLNTPIIDPMVARVYGIGLAAFVIIGVRFGTLGFSPLSLWQYYTQMDDEIWEFYAALGFCALAAFDLAHRLRDWRAGSPTARHAAIAPDQSA